MAEACQEWCSDAYSGHSKTKEGLHPQPRQTMNSFSNTAVSAAE